MGVLQLMMGHQSSGVAPAVVTITPDPATASTVTPTAASVSPTAGVTSGVGPFTYLWSIASGGVGCTLTNATLATCTIATTTGLPGQFRTGTLNCDVTDTGNASLVSSDTGDFELEVS